LLAFSNGSWGWNCESNCGRLGWFSGKYECKTWRIANCARDQSSPKKWVPWACGAAGAVSGSVVCGGVGAAACAAGGYAGCYKLMNN